MVLIEIYISHSCSLRQAATQYNHSYIHVLHSEYSSVLKLFTCFVRLIIPKVIVHHNNPIILGDRKASNSFILITVSTLAITAIVHSPHLGFREARVDKRSQLCRVVW